MVDSSKQEETSPQQEQNPQQQDQPKLIIPLDPTPLVEFNLDNISLKPNNEVALLYLNHPNKKVFLCVSNFISRYFLREAFTRTPTQYKEYLYEFWYTAKVLKETNRVWFSTPTGGIKGEVGLTSFRNAIGANYLAYSRQYVEPPSMEIIREWFSSIGYSREIEAKGTLKNGFLPPRWRLLIAQIIQCLGGKTRRYDQISNKDAIILYYLVNGVKIDFAKLIWDDIVSKLSKRTREKIVPYPRFISLLLEQKMEGYKDDKEPVAFEAPNTSVYNRKKVPKGKKSGAKTGHRKKSTSLLTKMIISSIITHSESASEHDISTSSKAGADSGLSAHKNLVSQTIGNDEGPNKLSLDHILAGNGAVNITKEIEDEFKTSLNLFSSDDAQKDIKLADLSKLI
ncbi:hypothetical protein Tco_1344434 [Tanacetum coccineum]